MKFEDIKIGNRVRVTQAHTVDGSPRAEAGLAGLVTDLDSLDNVVAIRSDSGEVRWADPSLLGPAETSGVDMVNHPPHYTALNGLEVIDVTEQFNFCLGNVLKYVMRADHKHDDNGITDLQKAAFYLQREIDRRQREASA